MVQENTFSDKMSFENLNLKNKTIFLPCSYKISENNFTYSLENKIVETSSLPWTIPSSSRPVTVIDYNSEHETEVIYPSESDRP